MKAVKLVLSIIVMILMTSLFICVAQPIGQDRQKIILTGQIKYISLDYGIDEKYVQQLFSAGYTEAEIKAYLEALYPHEKIVISNETCRTLMEKYGIKAAEAAKCLQLGMTYDKDPEIIARLLADIGDIDRLELGFAKYGKAVSRNISDYLNKDGKTFDYSLFTTIASEFEVPAYIPQHLVSQGASVKEVTAILFFQYIYIRRMEDVR